MPLLPGDIRALTLTEAGSQSVAGLLAPVLRVTFRVRAHGPFSLEFPKSSYDPAKAEEAITAYGAEIVATLEGNREIQRMAESFTLEPVGQRVPTVNMVFTVGGQGHFETAILKEGFTAAAALKQVRDYTASLTRLTTKFGE